MLLFFYECLLTILYDVGNKYFQIVKGHDNYIIISFKEIKISNDKSYTFDIDNNRFYFNNETNYLVNTVENIDTEVRINSLSINVLVQMNQLVLTNDDNVQLTFKTNYSDQLIFGDYTLHFINNSKLNFKINDNNIEITCDTTGNFASTCLTDINSILSKISDTCYY